MPSYQRVLEVFLAVQADTCLELLRQPAPPLVQQTHHPFFKLDFPKRTQARHNVHEEAHRFPSQPVEVPRRTYFASHTVVNAESVNRCGEQSKAIPAMAASWLPSRTICGQLCVNFLKASGTVHRRRDKMKRPRGAAPCRSATYAVHVSASPRWRSPNYGPLNPDLLRPPAVPTAFRSTKLRAHRGHGLLRRIVASAPAAERRPSQPLLGP